KEYVDTFTFVRFEPQGMVSGHPNIKLATSVIDFVFRVLGMEYLGRTDLVQIAPSTIDQTGEPAALHPQEEDFVGLSPAQRIASPDAPAIPTSVTAATPAAPAVTPPAALSNGNGTAHKNGNGNGNGTHHHEPVVEAIGSLKIQASAPAA